MNEAKRPFLAFLGLLLALSLTALACDIPLVGSNEPLPTPTPLGDTLEFLIPAFTYRLEPGETVPGTRLKYLQREGDVYRMEIDGLAANKRIGDSFLWSGTVAPGVFAKYNLRITTEALGQLPVVGPVELVVFNPQPVEVPVGETPAAALNYDLIAVNYLIPAGRQVPGSTLVFEGITTQAGEELAQMTGMSGYPLLALGDSLTWQGQLLSNVFIRYNLRVAALDENGLRLAGTAQLWVAP